MKQGIVTVAALLALSVAGAQSRVPDVRAQLVPDSVAVGGQTILAIDVERDLMQVVNFPALPPTDEQTGIEVIEEYPVDTLQREGRRLKLRKRYRLAAFEEGLIGMGRPRVLYIDKNIVDTLAAQDSLLLRVTTYEIDSTAMPYGVKPQRTLPFRLGEISGYAGWSLLALALLAAVVWAVLWALRRHGRSIGSLFKPAPPVPPHVRAIRDLEELHNRKLWQNNRHKLYYSSLTDILRTYIAGRWGVGAMEMTSDEIIRALREVEMPDKSRMEMTSVLRDADLVKFAKAVPEAEQNEGDYLKCYYFVEETKEQEAAAPGGEESEILDSKFKGDA